MSHDRLFQISFSMACVVAMLGLAAEAFHGSVVAAVIQGVMVVIVAYQVMFMRRHIAIANRHAERKELQQRIALQFDTIARSIDASLAASVGVCTARAQYEAAIAAGERDARAGGPGLAPTMGPAHER